MTPDTAYGKYLCDIDQLAGFFDDQTIPASLYEAHHVYRGLRDLNGDGVLAGLTNISKVTAKKVVNGVDMPMDGKLFYRGIDIKDIVSGFLHEDRFGFEETIYLLLFGHLPTVKELAAFTGLLHGLCSLPPKFVRDIIMKAATKDMMNALARSVLMLYYYDDNPDDISVPNVLRQCLQLIAQMPLLAVYGYHAYNHYEKSESLYIHAPSHKLSFAENILHILRPDQQYTPLEAKLLDLSLVLHAEHGGGNNSSFTMHVVSSSGTDTYSAVAASLGSLKGPRHGGANIQVSKMMEDLKNHVTNLTDEGQIADYLTKLLHKEAFDRSGLIYGIGHAIYSLSDPRALLFEGFVEQLSKQKGREEEYLLYQSVARLAPELIRKERKMYKGVSANIDFYSGFVYDMLGLPVELYTPIFAISRMAGWSAHRMESLLNDARIIRPQYRYVGDALEYVPLHNRKA
ncbi:MAG: citrate/2-methylcitrate synthase [Clostridiales bacterium]|nr:citrate/2-methylcitrate synthase [Clostridiales bacterium]